MKFETIATFFENIEKTSKKIEKTLILRDFFLEYKNESIILFDIISGNHFKELNKKQISISIKTIFAVIKSITNLSTEKIEKIFNDTGDIGVLCEKTLKSQNQSMLNSQELSLKEIIETLKNISQTKGSQSNKKKIESLSKLFLTAKTTKEKKYIARLLINDLRIGVNEGILKEAIANVYFPNILNINLACNSCGYININSKECKNCKSEIKQEEQEQQKAYNSFKECKIVDIIYDDNTIQKEISKLIKSEKNLKSICINSDKPREMYNFFLDNLEKKYNIINSFQKLCTELDTDILNIFNQQIIPGYPIKSMLGIRVNNIKEGFDISQSNMFLIDYKYDGLRLQIHRNENKTYIFTRNLDEISNQFTEITNFIEKNFKNDSFVIDCECIGYDYKNNTYLPFNILSKRILTKNIEEVKEINIALKIFDVLYYNNESLIEKEYSKRREYINKMLINKKLTQKTPLDDQNMIKIITQKLK